MLSHSRSLISAVAVLIVSMSTAIAAGNDAGPQSLPDAAATTKDLRRLCGDWRIVLSSGANADSQDIVVRHDRALAACSRLIESGGLSGRDLAEVLLDRADIYPPGTDENYALAMADYNRAISMAPTMADAYARRGRAHLFYFKDLPQGLRDIDEAIRLDGTRAEYFVTRAAMKGQDVPDEQLADLDRALALDPASQDALLRRAQVFFNKGDLASARADFDKAVSVAPNAVEPYFLRAGLRRAAGDDDGADADEAKGKELLSRKAP